jgi:hypothetical protein
VCERSGEGEIIASATGSWASTSCAASGARKTRCCSSSPFPTSRSAPTRRTAIFEALSLINEQLWLGHFDCGRVGMVVFRHSTILDTRDGDGLSLEQAEAIAERPVEECERFYPGLSVRAVGRENRPAKRFPPL